VRSIDFGKTEDTSSKTKPIILPCTCCLTRSVFPGGDDDGDGKKGKKKKEAKFLYKLDDVRKDLIVMKCSEIIKQVCLKHTILSDLPVVSYCVLPVSKGTGILEFVEGTNMSKIGDITNHILALKNIQGQDKRQTFIRSSAMATVLVYIFGIGDRHLDNLMITDDGKLVNIDFGHIEGDDQLNSAYARIPSQIIDFGDNLEEFSKWCCCIYLELRRYAMHFHSLLMSLHTAEEQSDADIKVFDDFIRDRFCEEMDDDEAVKKLTTFIETSRSGVIGNKIRDWIHKSGQLFQSFVKNMPTWFYGTPESKPSAKEDYEEDDDDETHELSIIFREGNNAGAASKSDDGAAVASSAAPAPAPAPAAAAAASKDGGAVTAAAAADGDSGNDSGVNS